MKNMNTSKRIIINTSITYLRSIFAAFVGIFTTRWVLNSLGVEDYGLYGLVGSILVFISFLNNVLAGAISRYFAYEVGRRNNDELNKWFNAAIRIHLLVPIFLVIIGLIIGTIAINCWLNIEIENIKIASVVFYISLFSASVSMCLAPYRGMLLAKQDISQQSIIEILQSLCHVILMYVLTLVNRNQLLIYSIMMAAESVIFQILIALRANHIYSEISIKNYKYHELKSYVLELFSFSAWKSLIGFGVMMFNQGLSIILNLFFGTKLNAAYSVASNLSAQSNTISNALMMSITPEIVSRQGAGNKESMIRLALKACKYSTLMVLLIAVPLFLDIDNLLLLWLKTPPQYTGILCRFIIISLVIDKLTSGLESAINACGQIKKFQISVGLSYILGVLLTILLLLIKKTPIIIGVSYLITQSMILVMRLFWARKLVGIQLWRWVSGAFNPIAIVSLLTVSGCLFMMNCLPKLGIVRLITITLSSTFSLFLFAWLFVLEVNLKEQIKARLSKHK